MRFDITKRSKATLSNSIKSDKLEKRRIKYIVTLAVLLSIIFIVIFACYFASKWDFFYGMDGRNYSGGELTVNLVNNITEINMIEIREEMANKSIQVGFSGEQDGHGVLIKKPGSCDIFFKAWRVTDQEKEKDETFKGPMVSFWGYKMSLLNDANYSNNQQFMAEINGLKDTSEPPNEESIYNLINEVGQIIGADVDWDSAVWTYKYFTMTSEGSVSYNGYPPTIL